MPLNTYSHLYLYNMIFLHIFLEIICISINIYTNWQRCKRKLYLHQCTHTSMHTCIHTMHTYKRTHLFHIQADMYIYINMHVDLKKSVDIPTHLYMWEHSQFMAPEYYRLEDIRHQHAPIQYTVRLKFLCAGGALWTGWGLTFQECNASACRAWI